MASTEDADSKMPKQAAELKRLNEAATAAMNQGNKAEALKLLTEQGTLLDRLVEKIQERQAARKAKKKSKE